MFNWLVRKLKKLWKLLIVLKDKTFFFLLNFYKNLLNFSDTTNLFCFIFINIILIINFWIFSWKISLFLIFTFTPLSFFNYFKPKHYYLNWVYEVNFFWLKLFTLFLLIEIYLLSWLIFIGVYLQTTFLYWFVIIKLIFDSAVVYRLSQSYISFLALFWVCSFIFEEDVKEINSFVGKKSIYSSTALLFFACQEISFCFQGRLVYQNISDFIANFNFNLNNLNSNSKEYKIILEYFNMDVMDTDIIFSQTTFKLIASICVFIKSYNMYIFVGMTFLLVNIIYNESIKNSKEVCTFLIQNLIILSFFYIINYILLYELMYVFILDNFNKLIIIDLKTQSDFYIILEFFKQELLFNYISM